MIDIPKHLIDLLTVEVPDGLKEHEDCIKAYQAVLNELKTPHDIFAVCVHEGGHFIYAMKLGAITGFEASQITMRPPLIEHTTDFDGNNYFSPVPGSIHTPFNGRTIDWTIEVLEAAAEVAVAGGVFAGKLADRPEKGIAGDRELLKNYYRLALKTLHSNPLLPEFSDLWKEAKTRVERTVDVHTVFLEQAKSIGENYRASHFGPYLAFCSKNSGVG